MRIANDLMRDYYVERASAGIIISEATTISEEANGWPQTPGIYTPEMTAGWKRVTDAVRAAGGMMACQLWHMARASHTSFQPGNVLPVAPSAIAITGSEVRGIDDR